MAPGVDRSGGVPGSEEAIAASVTLKLRSPSEALRLFGRNDEHLRALRGRLAAKVVARGDEVRLSGPPDAVAEAERTFRSLLATIRSGGEVHGTEIAHADLGRFEPPRRDERDGEGPSLGLPGRTRPKTVNQRHYVDAIREHPITFGIGPAGTGKTYLAVAMAVQALTSRQVKRVILTRPAVEAGEHLGFLPGDLQAKIDPYLRPLYDALYDMMPPDRVDQLLETRTIEVAPLAFMRGRTLNDAFIILDEAQNTTEEQMLMFLTRMGFDSKCVVTGDLTQIDLPNSRRSGLVEASKLLAQIPDIGIVHLDESDVVRHELVRRIINAYNDGRSQ